MVWLLGLLLTGLVLGGEVKNRCEVKLDRCLYDCANAYPFDDGKRKGCELRCRLNYALCESARAIDRVGKEVREFLEGFSGKEFGIFNPPAPSRSPQP
jgi:hypothetical protein